MTEYERYLAWCKAEQLEPELIMDHSEFLEAVPVMGGNGKQQEK